MKAQRGQALAELALVAPLFAILLTLFSFWANLTITRLALIQLSRDATLMFARNGDLWAQDEASQLAALRRYAVRQAKLDPARLRLSYQSISPMGLDKLPQMQSALSGPIGHKVKEWAGMRRYRFEYERPIGGLAGKVLGGRVTLREEMVVHGDPWKMEMNTLIQKLL